MATSARSVAALFTFLIVLAAASAVASPPVVLAAAAPPAAAPAAAGADLAASALGLYTPPTCVPGVPFSDITCTTGFDPWIEQFGRDGISAGCGGGLYCPTSPVTRDQMAVFIEKAMRGTGNWPAHTQLVWAVKAADGTPDPVASGTGLLNAVAAIPTSGNDVPSNVNPWLVKVGPGVFDLNGASLALPAWVTLDGAGQGTVIKSNSPAYVVGASGAWNQVSNVSLTNASTGANTVVVSASGAVLILDHAWIVASGGTSSTVGVSSSNSNVSIFDGYMFVVGSVNAYGIYTSGGSAYAVSVARTQFSCNTRDVSNNAGQVIQLAYAQVPDPLYNTGAGVYQCIGNYNNSLAPVTCP